MKTLQCGCCGESFKGRQHWNWDTSFGRCLKCCASILQDSRPCAADEKQVYIVGMQDQWPDQWQIT